MSIDKDLLDRLMEGRSPGDLFGKTGILSELTKALAERALNMEMFDNLDDARRKLALWRYDYNNTRPYSSLGNQTPAEARRTLELNEGSAPGALAQTDDEEYENQIRRLPL